jgi:imidazole glycerol phosphate synthase glutamine amidotransferase subunit
MARLRESGLDDAVANRVRTGRPTLAVCLGLHLLCEASEESPGVAGLAVLPGMVRRFPETVRVPQLGWNQVEPESECALLSAGHAYFANSYRLTDTPPGFRAAWADHGGRFIAALERGSVLCCQFHPELSGAYGLALLERWMATEGPC